MFFDHNRIILEIHSRRMSQECLKLDKDITKIETISFMNIDEKILTKILINLIYNI